MKRVLLEAFQYTRNYLLACTDLSKVVSASMKTLTIKITPELHEQFKLYCIRKRLSMSGRVIAWITGATHQPKQKKEK